MKRTGSAPIDKAISSLIAVIAHPVRAELSSVTAKNDIARVANAAHKKFLAGKLQAVLDVIEDKGAKGAAGALRRHEVEIEVWMKKEFPAAR